MLAPVVTTNSQLTTTLSSQLSNIKLCLHSLFSERFVADLVVSLCTGKSDLLDKFVAQAFDANGKKFSLFLLNI